jgi:AraC-like DNA-binding protein
MENAVLLNIGFAELNANWNWKNVYSPFARFYYVKSGSATTCIKDRLYSLEPGYLYLTPPFSLHQDECDDYFSLYYVHFYEQLLNKESIFDKYEFPVGVRASALDLALIERLLEINPGRHLVLLDPELYDNHVTFSRYAADNNKIPLHLRMETQSILSMLMAHFFENRHRKTMDKDARINKSLQYVHEHINQEISLSALAEIACVSDDHFIRLFKKEMSITPIKYIRAKKIEKAQLLLLTTGAPIKNIAMELSMDNISYFNRLFRAYTGKTPLEYRMEYGG